MLHVREAMESPPMGGEIDAHFAFIFERGCAGDWAATLIVQQARRLQHPTSSVLAQRRRLFVQAGT